MSTLHCIGKITCEHDYSSTAKGLELIPTEETKAFCQRENLWIFQKDASVEIYADALDESLINTELIFWIKVTDTQFYNYIQLPDLTLNPNHLLFFSNEETEQVLPSKLASIKNVQHRTQIVIFDEVVQEEGEIKVYHQNGEPVYSVPVQKGAKSAFIDLAYEDDGMYTWTFGGYTGTFYLTDMNLKQMLGVCSFQIQSAEEHRINIQFETKKTYWEYLIVSKESLSENDYHIIDTQGHYTFSCHGKVPLIDAEAMSFVSDQLIPYKAYPTTAFKLVPNMDDQQVYLHLEDRILPNASPRNIQIHDTTETAVFKTQTILYI